MSDHDGGGWGQMGDDRRGRWVEEDPSRGIPTALQPYHPTTLQPYHPTTLPPSEPPYKKTTSTTSTPITTIPASPIQRSQASKFDEGERTISGCQVGCSEFGVASGFGTKRKDVDAAFDVN